ncbi:unnamed protein product [Lampetra planeri]
MPTPASRSCWEPRPSWSPSSTYELPPMEEAAPEPRGVHLAAAAVHTRDSPATPPDRSAAILAGTRGAEATISLQQPASPRDIPALQRRLPFIRKFTAACRDWEAFKRRFPTNWTLAGWTDVEALKAIPTCLDDDALSAFYAIPPEKRTTLAPAFSQMAAVYDQPSCVRHRFAERRRGASQLPLAFAERRRGEAETPLAFHSALLSLAQTVFLTMEQAGVD